jgi:hypothetical protein
LYTRPTLPHKDPISAGAIAFTTLFRHNNFLNTNKTNITDNVNFLLLFQSYDGVILGLVQLISIKLAKIITIDPTQNINHFRKTDTNVHISKIFYSLTRGLAKIDSR